MANIRRPNGETMLRKTLTLLCLSAACNAMATSLNDDLASCRTIAAAEQRLACYDNIANQQDTPQSSATRDNTATSGSVFSNPFKEIFGFEEKEIAKQIPDRIDVEVSAISQGYGKLQITLSNGQVWRQLDNKHFAYSEDNGQAYIQRGALGSFLFSQEGTKKRIRVKRIK